MKKEIIALFDKDFLGDKNQSTAVAQALIKLTESSEAKVIELDEADLSEQKISELTNNHIVIAAGAHGLAAIAKIKSASHSTKPVTILTAHQYLGELNTLPIGHFPDIIGLPTQTLEEKQKTYLEKNTLFISLTGVPHNVTTQSIEEDVKAFKNPPDLKDKTPVGIILGGDAPDHKTGGKKFFTPEDASKRAGFIIQDLKTLGLLKKETVLLITNGPRTGQHNYTTGEEITPNPHRTSQLDEVTKAFLNELTKLEILDSQINLFNFNYQPPSAYKPILKWVSEKKGSFMFLRNQRAWSPKAYMLPVEERKWSFILSAVKMKAIHFIIYLDLNRACLYF